MSSSIDSEKIHRRTFCCAYRGKTWLCNIDEYGFMLYHNEMHKNNESNLLTNHSLL